jgi:hypothetical protein
MEHQSNALYSTKEEAGSLSNVYQKRYTFDMSYREQRNNRLPRDKRSSCLTRGSRHTPLCHPRFLLPSLTRGSSHMVALACLDCLGQQSGGLLSGEAAELRVSPWTKPAMTLGVNSNCLYRCLYQRENVPLRNL